MNLELKHFRIFITIANMLHFGRAAEKLNMAQPQLSRTVQFIEKEVGCPLMVRSTRSVSLTAAGEVFLEQCRSIIERTETALRVTRETAQGRFGSLNVAYMDFAISGPLPPILRAFRGRFDRVGVNLSHMWTERQRRALLDRETDIGFLIGPFEHPEIDSIRVGRDRLMIVLPNSHRLAASMAIDLRCLANDRFIFGSMTAWRPYRDLIDQICLEHGFLPRAVEEPFNSDAIFGLVSANLGITIYPERARRIYPRGVTVRPIADVTRYVETIAAWHKRSPSKTLHNFIEVVSEYSAAPPYES